MVIADTAGRLHTQSNLMDELAKIKRVMAKLDADAPHETLLIMDAGFGQNALQQAQQFNDSLGLTGLAVTKLDVLGGLEALKICTAYEYRGEIVDNFPASLKVLGECKPVYETLPGWSEDISGVQEMNDLPTNVKNYLNRIEELTRIPIDLISVGAERTQTIVKKNFFL